MNQSDEKKDNIQRVIETALDMFMENGIAATSMNQIAQKVNLSQMSLYRYFGNKEELILRIWKYALTEFYRYFYERYTGDENASTGYERFVACMRAYYSLYEEFPNWYKYTHEMFTYRFSHDETADRGMSSVFWSHYDKEIPIPALKALKDSMEQDPEKAKKYAELLYTQGLIMANLPLEDPTAYTDLVCGLMQ